MNKKSILLIEVIIIVILLAIVAFGIGIYIFEGLRLNLTNINQAKAIYMAQSGIMRATVDFSDDGLWSPVRNANIGGEFYYHLGEDANFLLVDASSPLVSGKLLRRIPIKNISATSAIVVTDVEVIWEFGGNITSITFGNINVWSGTPTASPANLDINDFSIASGTLYDAIGDQQWIFTNNISGNLIINFIFSDGSSYKAYLLKNEDGSTVCANKEFSITATGEIRSASKVEARRTLVATYDSGTNNITSWEESQEHIIP